MNRMWMAIAAAAVSLPLSAQQLDNQERTLTCSDENNDGRRSRHCEMKEQTIPATGRLSIEPGPNGGVTVKGWKRSDILVRTRIQTSAPSDSEARSLVNQVNIVAGGGQIRSTGPQLNGDRNWSTTYEIFVPTQTDLSIHATNGGIGIRDVRGHIEFTTSNGGVSLQRLAGTVKGTTTNGGVKVDLGGDRWDGNEFDVRTTNGGIQLLMPANYNARIETGTTNGGFNSDFPVTLQGKITKNVSFSVGSGGAPIRVYTVNGGVSIKRS